MNATDELAAKLAVESDPQTIASMIVAAMRESEAAIAALTAERAGGVREAGVDGDIGHEETYLLNLLDDRLTSGDLHRAMNRIRHRRGGIDAVSFALKALCDAWDGQNDGGYYRGNVTNATANGRNALAALPPAEPAEGAVKVKGLEWVDLSDSCIAHTPFGVYKVARAGDTVNMFIARSELPKSFHAALDEAKAAAQADYEARILSALTAAPAPALVTEPPPVDHGGVGMKGIGG